MPPFDDLASILHDAVIAIHLTQDHVAQSQLCRSPMAASSLSSVWHDDHDAIWKGLIQIQETISGTCFLSPVMRVPSQQGNLKWITP